MILIFDNFSLQIIMLTIFFSIQYLVISSFFLSNEKNYPLLKGKLLKGNVSYPSMKQLADACGPGCVAIKKNRGRGRGSDALRQGRGCDSIIARPYSPECNNLVLLLTGIRTLSPGLIDTQLPSHCRIPWPVLVDFLPQLLIVCAW